MSDNDYTEDLGIYYRSIGLIIIGAAFFIIYCMSNEKSPRLRWLFIASQTINIAWQCSIFMRYYDPISRVIITSITPLMILSNFLATNQLLEIYTILDPDRITPRLLFIMRVVGSVMASIMFIGLAFFPAASIPNFAIGFTVTISCILYDQIQSLYLLKLVYATKGELKSQLYSPFRIVTAAVLIINVFDYASLGLYYYNVIILPDHISVFPFLVNLAGIDKSKP